MSGFLIIGSFCSAGYGGWLLWLWYRERCSIQRLRTRQAQAAFAQQSQRQREQQRRQQQQQQQRTAAERKRQQRLKTLQALARKLQVALINVSNAPDFRRTAAILAGCTAVPIQFRKKQFKRFRSHLVKHFRRCLEQGQDVTALIESLRELVSLLGYGEFEADYIRTEAERVLAPQPESQASFGQELERKQREHTQRLAEIKRMQVEPNIKTQLVEREQHRFETEMMGDDPNSFSGEIAL